MEAEVAAAARGLLTGGADEVVVFDNHASGNPLNVRPESLPAGARLETWNMFDLRERGVDALLQVGYHARAELDASSRTLTRRSWCSRGRGADQREPRSRAADVPLLGTAVTTSTLARLARSTASPTSSRNAPRRRWMPAARHHSTRSRALPRTSCSRAASRSDRRERARFEAFVRGESLMRWTSRVGRTPGSRSPTRWRQRSHRGCMTSPRST